MGKNLVRKTFTGESTWECPPGVNRVRVRAVRYLYNQISMGRLAGLFLTPAGVLYASGQASSTGTGLSTVSSPTLVQGGFQWQMVASGENLSLGITVAGDGYAWGIGDHGDLGNGAAPSTQSSPVLILGGNKWKFLVRAKGDVQAQHCMGIDSVNSGLAWGRNTSGQLGVGDVTPRSSPVAIAGGRNWIRLAGGNASSYGIDNNGDMYGWGINAHGQLGLGDVTPRSSPVLVLGGHKWLDVVAAGEFVVGIKSTGDAYAWGRNGAGQLGVGDVVSRSSPVLVLGGLKWQHLAAADTNTSSYQGHVIGSTRLGTLYGWGQQTGGALGNNTNTGAVSSPVVISSTAGNWRQVAASDLEGMAISANGTAWGWGANSRIIGSGSPASAFSTPTVVATALKFPVVYEAEANGITIDVIPGVTYAVSAIYGYFGGAGIYQDAYLNENAPTKLVLEYFA